MRRSSHGRHWFAPRKVSVAPIQSNWLPTPPSSYSSSGTVSITDVGTVAGTTQLYGFFGPTSQRVVSNPNGHFVAYSHFSSNHSPEYWTLKRSPLNSISFSTVYNSESAGQTAQDPAPMLETDVNHNVYIIVGNYANASSLGQLQQIKVYKFSPSDNYVTPTIYTLDNSIVISAGKMTSFYDPDRDIIWVQIWAYVTGTKNLIAFNSSGAVVYNKAIFRPVGDHPNAYPHYSMLYLDRAGNLYCGWMTTDGPLNSTYQNYYDIHHFYTPDGGETFVGPPGNVAIPIIGDDSANSSWEIVDTTNSSEFISHGAPGYGTSPTTYNFNVSVGFAFNNDSLHSVYTGGHPSSHHPYARWNKTTKTINKRISPAFSDIPDGGTITAHESDNGGFAQDTSQTSRLYWVGAGTGPDFNKIVAMKSDNGGTTWSDYAKSAPIPQGYILYLNVFRWVLNDGSIVGGFINEQINPYVVKFLKITPN